MKTHQESHAIRFGAAVMVLFIVMLSLNVYAFQ